MRWTGRLTRRAAWRIAWPMIFANAAIPLAGVVDTAVIGATGTGADLAGVALGVTLFNVLYWSFYFLRMGSTGLAAQASGAGNRAELQRILFRASGLALGLGLVLLALRPLLATIGFGLLQGSPPAEAAGATYFRARIWGAPGAYLVFALTGWLIGLGRTRAVMSVNLVFSLTNAVLDLWFVLGLGLGVAGVASATAMADWAGALVGMGYAWQVIRADGGVDREARSATALWNRAALKRLFAVNGDMMIRSWALLAGFSWFANAGARQGTAVLAGNQVLLQVIAVWAFVLDAYAFTAEAAVGRAVGARSRADLRRAVRVTTELALASGALFLVLTVVAGQPVVEHWIADPAAREVALRYLPFCAAIPLLGAPAWQLDGIFVGAMRSAAMRNASIVATALYIGLDLLLTPAFGATGMWIAWSLYYVARAGTLAVAYPGLERAAGAGPA